jgi:two-component system, LytTR family, response regulator
MRRLRIAIVDDEPLARAGLRFLLEQDPTHEIVGEAGNGPAAVSLIQKTQPDLILLDIVMPGMDGFEVMEALGGVVRAGVIFISAHDEHAVRAFDVAALDYLLKPVDGTRFLQALTRARARLSDDAQPRLLVRERGRVLFVNAGEIDYIESADYYVELHLDRRTYLCRVPLTRLAEQLAPHGFVRLHRTVMINARRLHALEPEGNRRLCAVLQDGTRLRVSRREAARVRALLGGR